VSAIPTRNAGVIQSVGLREELTPEVKITVPTGHAWQILSVYAEFTTDAFAGNRNLFLTILDKDLNYTMRLLSGVAQPASTERAYIWAPGLPNEAAATSGVVLRSLPTELYLPSEATLRVMDESGVESVDDDLVVRLMIIDYVE
jgi:hypothetical protein